MVSCTRTCVLLITALGTCVLLITALVTTHVAQHMKHLPKQNSGEKF